MRPRLLIVSGARAGTEVSLSEKPFSIGRDQSADLSVEDAMVSPRHLAITLEDDHHYIEDTGSSNGTQLNGTP
jgi:pSer/pThr/pTyr-binding forkhead associated (FHA) protein